jgi:hypothetical protein
VLDPFLGKGSTLMAAERTGRILPRRRDRPALCRRRDPPLATHNGRARDPSESGVDFAALELRT